METVSVEVIQKFGHQDYSEIRDECLKAKKLFEDPLFKLDSKYEWKRPSEMTKDPQFIVEGVSRFDAIQGHANNCWLVSSLSLLAMHPELVEKVIPENQSFTTQYAGIFHFRLWRLGDWFDVVVDDRLASGDGRKVFIHSESENEYWPALLEKAFGKICCGELWTRGGNPYQGTRTLSGGIVEMFNIKKPPENFQDILLKSVSRGALVGCSAHEYNSKYEQDGLYKGHAYAINDVKKVNVPGQGDIVLVRLRNPWGSGEWTGAWSDSSPEWKSIPESTKQDLGLVIKNDGEFWMTYKDFMTRFETGTAEVVHLAPNFCKFDAKTPNVSNWHLESFKGKWVKGVNAGGNRDIHLNPKMKFTLSEADDDNKDGLCTVLIALGKDVKDDYNVAFSVYQLKDAATQETTLDQNFFKKNKPIKQSGFRVVEPTLRVSLAPGVYCVVPFTYTPGTEIEYVLRIYSERKVSMDEMEYKVGLSPSLSGTTPMKHPTDKDLKSKVELREGFYKVSGGDMEVGWEKLKAILDFAVKKDISSSTGVVDFFFDMFSAVYNMIHGYTCANAFETMDTGGFSKDVCRSMIALLDVDHTGKLSFNEFHILWSEIKKWQSIYQENTKESSHGYLESSELSHSLEAAGFYLDKQILGNITNKYVQQDGTISFDDFVRCCIKLSMTSEYFTSKEKTRSHSIEFTLEEYINKAM